MAVAAHEVVSLDPPPPSECLCLPLKIRVNTMHTNMSFEELPFMR